MQVLIMLTFLILLSLHYSLKDTEFAIRNKLKDL